MLMERTILIVSDLHLGAGEILGGKKNPLEDFYYDGNFSEFLEWKSKQGAEQLELLILGDALDFPQVLPEIGHSCQDPKLGTTQEESLNRLESIMQGHPIFFDALKSWLSKGNILRFLRGNHDIDLIWPDVQTRLRRVLGGDINLIFEKGLVYRDQGLYCEHGNQYSVENTFMNVLRPLVTGPHGEERLERCWGTYFMDIVYNDIEARFPIIDNVGDGQEIRGALLAMKSEKVHFTGKLVGQILKIAYRAGLPVTGWIGSWVMGEETVSFPPEDSLSKTRIATAEDFLRHLRDPELTEALLRRYKGEDDFRKQFETEIAEVIREQADEDVHLLPTEDINLTMGLLTGKNSYQRAAERILQEEDGVQIVVFGHTHAPVDGNHPPVELFGDVAGKYFNSGSWTSSLDLDDPRNQGLSFDELCKSGIRKDTLDYVEVTISSDGGVQAALGRA
jgi:UDP-2,3-diacylglucosamine pyrophosphatase LpxH